MQDPQFLDPANRELAEALENLRLAPGAIAERDIWYQAGVDAGRRRAVPWKAAAAIMAIGLAATQLHQALEPARTMDRVVYAPAENRPLVSPVGMPPASPALSATNLRMRNAVLLNGLEALPLPSGGGDDTPSLQPRSAPPRDAI